MTEIKQPKIRFNGYIADWEQHKLYEHTELITKGTTPKDKSNIGNINFVKVENLSNGKINSNSKISELEHNGYLKRSILKENDILFSIAGTLGKTAIVDKSILPANINQALAIIRGYDFDKNFLITSLMGSVVSEYIRKNPTIGAQPNLSLEQVKNLCINTPSIEEQSKIGEFFKTLDDTISLHQQKLEVTKQFKQTMLKKMFPKNGKTKPEIRFKGFTEDWRNEKFLDICSVKKGTQLNKDTLSKEKTETFKYPVYNGSVNPIGYTTEYNKEKGLIMTEGGDVGRVLFSEKPFWSSGHSYNITSVDNNIYYLQYLFESNYGKINSKGLGVTIKNLSLNSLKQIILTVTSNYKEQELIGNYFKELDNQINALEQKLEKYKLFKKAMLQKMFI